MPSLELTQELLAARDHVCSKSQQAELRPLLETVRRDVALVVWGHLADLARVQAVLHASNQQSVVRLHLTRETRLGMATELARDLGLGQQHRQLVTRLLEEFLSWLQECPEHSYTAPWGTMILQYPNVLLFRDVARPQRRPTTYEPSVSLLQPSRR